MVGHARGNERMRELQENGAAPTGNHDDLAIDLPGDGARIQPDRARAGEPRANRRAMPVEGRGSGGHPGIVALAGEGRPEAGGATAFAENQPPDAADGAILEWRLSELYWITEGVRPFITDAVPYSINNDGAASAAAAAVLFANCTDAAPGQDAIHVLEAGAGTALFARYLLDEFRDLCRRHGRNFYDRLVSMSPIGRRTASSSGAPAGSWPNTVHTSQLPSATPRPRRPPSNDRSARCSPTTCSTRCRPPCCGGRGRRGSSCAPARPFAQMSPTRWVSHPPSRMAQARRRVALPCSRCRRRGCLR
jgi:hypothetical protein